MKIEYLDFSLQDLMYITPAGTLYRRKRTNTGTLMASIVNEIANDITLDSSSFAKRRSETAESQRTET